jgi:hypothetical protein
MAILIFNRDEEGRCWIVDMERGMRYPLFNHPEINESSTQEEMEKVCKEIDKEVYKNG